LEAGHIELVSGEGGGEGDFFGFCEELPARGGMLAKEDAIWVEVHVGGRVAWLGWGGKEEMPCAEHGIGCRGGM